MVDGKTVIRIALLAAIAGFGGGFAWGLNEHTGTEAVENFIDSAALDEKYDGALALSCRKGSQPLLLYDLRTGAILTNPKEIERLKSASISKVMNNGFVGRIMAEAAAAYTAFFSFSNEVKRYAKTERKLLSNPILMIGAVLVPTAYLGYHATDLLNLECSSRSLYDLAKKKDWALNRFVAASKIFEAFEFCFDRSLTIPADKSYKFIVQQLPVDWARNHRAAILEWRQFIAPANTNLPNQSLMESRFEREPLLVSPANDQLPGVTWGDAVFQRIYGGHVLGGTDFTILLAARERCAQLDVDKARELYSKTRPMPPKPPSDADFGPAPSLNPSPSDADLGFLQNTVGGATASPSIQRIPISKAVDLGHD